MAGPQAPFPAHPLTPWPPLVVNVALSGVVTGREHTPAVPFTAAECASDAAACFAAGARIVHLHARDGDGKALSGDGAWAELVGAVRGACPGLLICVTTSARTGLTVAARLAPLALAPDFASLTLGPVDFGGHVGGNSLADVDELSRAFDAAGVRPEFEVFDLGMIHTLHRMIDRGLAEPPFSVNLMLGFPNGAPATLHALSALVQALPEGTHWSAAGRGAFQRPVAMLAAASGGGIRTGLEDNPYADHLTRRPADNQGLVAEAAGFGRVLGRPIAEPAELHALLGVGADGAAVA